MSGATDVIAKAIGQSKAYPLRTRGDLREVIAHDTITALSEAGYSIIHKDEIHEPTIEICREAYEAHDKVGRLWIHHSLWDNLNREAANRVAALVSFKISEAKMDEAKRQFAENVAKRLDIGINSNAPTPASKVPS